MSTPDPVRLVVRDARVEVDGAVACERLGFEAQGTRISIAGGAVAALSAAVSGRGKLVSGSMTVDDLEVAHGGHFGRVGIAPLDPPMPASSSAQDFVALSLRMAGASLQEANRLAGGILGSLELGQIASRRIRGLALAERRALAIAQAMLPQARALFAEAPLSGLEPSAASFVLGVLAAASRSRAIITTALRIDPLAPERDLLAGSDRVVLLSGETLAWSGEPAQLMQSNRMLLLQLRGDTDAFMTAAREASIELEGSPPRLLARLPESMTTRKLFELAESTHAVVLELLPVWSVK